MKLLVAAKHVVDPNIKVRVNQTQTEVLDENCRKSLNPFDERAIEEAVKLKQQGLVSEIIAVTIGSKTCIAALHLALARGADRGILIETDLTLEPINIAKVFKQIIINENPDIIFFGKQATDNDANQVGQMLAGMLNYPQAIAVSAIKIVDNLITVSCEVEYGIQSFNIVPPAVLTADLHLNEPKFLKLTDLMLGKKKSINVIALQSFTGGEFAKINQLNTQYKVVKATDGDITKECQFLHNCDELISLIRKFK